MVQPTTREISKGSTELGLIDCDIHNALPTSDSLKPYLSERWWKHQKTIGLRGYTGYVSGVPYPKLHPSTARVDSWPPSGLPPGSDLSFMQEQHLDPLNVEYGILNCLYDVGGQLNDEYAAALARAVNDWQIAEWLDKDPRLRASIVLPYENAELAAAEIERVGEHPGFVQILLLGRAKEPLGSRKYWKIYDVAENYGLPVGMHVIIIGGNPITPSGWPSYYIEAHTSLSAASQAQVNSFVLEGAFEQFPGLRVVLTETGFAWLPPLMWRLDKHWKRLREEVPHLKRLPSEYIREHMWVTTQPIEEPHNPGDILETIEQLDSGNMLLFSTDYPHWDADDPNRAFPVRLPEELERKIRTENARALYQLEPQE